MPNERIKMQGRKVEKRRKLKELELKADNLISNIRDIIDPFEDWLALETARGQAAMNELHDVAQKGRQIRNDIDELDKALGNE